MAQLKEIAFWDWDYLISLPKGEFDWIDYKSSRKATFDSESLQNISEYLSAFSNYDGGYLVFGMVPHGDGSYVPDDGVELNHPKYGNLKEWLEDKLPGLVDPPTSKIGVHAIPNPSTPEKGVIVIHVPESEIAPHQGHKERFYSRRGSKNRALTTREIFDIKGRKKHPNLVAEVSIFLRRETSTNNSRINLRITNDSDVLCVHWGARLRVPTVYKNRFLNLNDHGYVSEEEEKLSWILGVMNGSPLFPRASLLFPFNFKTENGNLPIKPSSERVEVRLFAEEAPFKDISFNAAEIFKRDSLGTSMRAKASPQIS